MVSMVNKNFFVLGQVLVRWRSADLDDYSSIWLGRETLFDGFLELSFLIIEF